MKVLLLNNDFRVYWRARLSYLHQFFADKQIDFYAVELFGQGSPYAFDTLGAGGGWWHCVFPDKSAADLSKEEIKAGLFKVLDHIAADIIIGPSIVFYSGALGIQWAKKHQGKFIMFDDAKPAQVKRNFIVQWVKDTITAEADALWLPAESYANDYSYFKSKDVLFFYGYDTVNNDFFKPAAVRTSFGNTFICVARLVPVKNIDNLLRAWKTVEDVAPDAGLMLIGNGREGDKLKELAQSLKLNTVTFVGTVNNADLPSHYHQADAMILPSLSETWGLVINEGMAAGLPVLLSRTINAAKDLLREGENGFGFEPENVEEMAESILKFTRLTNQQKRDMAAASLTIIDGMSYEAMGKRLYLALEQLQTYKYKRPGLIAQRIINAWHGRYNTAGWDRL